MRQPKLRRRPLNKALVEQLYHVEYSAEQIRLAGGTAAAGGVLLGLAGLAADAQAATFTVSNLNDSGAGSLRQAILDAEAAPDADTILFQSGLSGTIQLTTGHLQIDYSVNVQGPARTSSRSAVAARPPVPSIAWAHTAAACSRSVRKWCSISPSATRAAPCLRSRSAA